MTEENIVDRRCPICTARLERLPDGTVQCSNNAFSPHHSEETMRAHVNELMRISMKSKSAEIAVREIPRKPLEQKTSKGR